MNNYYSDEQKANDFAAATKTQLRVVMKDLVGNDIENELNKLTEHINEKVIEITDIINTGSSAMRDDLYNRTKKIDCAFSEYLDEEFKPYKERIILSFDEVSQYLKSIIEKITDQTGRHSEQLQKVISQGITSYNEEVILLRDAIVKMDETKLSITQLSEKQIVEGISTIKNSLDETQAKLLEKIDECTCSLKLVNDKLENYNTTILESFARQEAQDNSNQRNQSRRMLWQTITQGTLIIICTAVLYFLLR